MLFRTLLHVLIATLGMSGVLVAQDRPPADQLLKDADRARGGLATGITWNATVAVTGDGPDSSRTFLV